MAWYYRTKRRKIVASIVLPCIIFFTIFYCYFKVSTSFLTLSEDKVYDICFNLINNVVINKISEIDSEKIIDYKYDIKGNILAVNANVITMNILNSKIAEEITKEFRNLDNIYVHIPLGSFLSSNLFPAIGPKIAIKILPLSNIHTEYRTEFSSKGINQTQHKIFIKINCDVKILSNLSTNYQQIDLEIPIAETILIGGVPNTYITFPNQSKNINH